MRTNSLGRRTFLRDDIADIFTDNLPHGEENDSFLRSKDCDKMLDLIEEAIKDHIDDGIGTALRSKK